MLESLAKHARFDLKVKAEGDVHVSYHHTVEDCGIVFGQALKVALGDKKGIRRYGWSLLPMDEALIMCSLDLSGRPLFFYEDLGLRRLPTLTLSSYGSFLRASPLRAGRPFT